MFFVVIYDESKWIDPFYFVQYDKTTLLHSLLRYLMKRIQTFQIVLTNLMKII